MRGRYQLQITKYPDGGCYELVSTHRSFREAVLAAHDVEGDISFKVIDSADGSTVWEDPEFKSKLL